MAVPAIPDGFQSLTPYLVVRGATDLIYFLNQAFEAVEYHRATHPDDSIMYAQLQIGDSFVMLSEASDEFKPMPGRLYLYVEDVDVVYQRALQAGATSLREPVDEFYGDRSGIVQDMCGNHWHIATHKEDVPPDEILRRQRELSNCP